MRATDTAAGQPACGQLRFSVQFLDDQQPQALLQGVPIVLQVIHSGGVSAEGDCPPFRNGGQSTRPGRLPVVLSGTTLPRGADLFHPGTDKSRPVTEEGASATAERTEHRCASGGAGENGGTVSLVIRR
jgi:hypothetical protein